MKTILITNRKGGVGKTTTALNLAYFFSKEGKKTLLIDFDTQGHLQQGLGVRKKLKGIHSFLEEEKIEKIYKTKYENLFFIPATINFDTSKITSKYILKKSLRNIRKKFDICIIDTPPTTDILLFNALMASNYAIIPMQTEYLSFVGAMQFLELLYKESSKLRVKLKLLGVLPTLFSPSIKEHKEVIEELKKRVGDKKVLLPIRKDFKLSKSFYKGEPIYEFDKFSRGSKDYEKLYHQIKNMLK